MTEFHSRAKSGEKNPMAKLEPLMVELIRRILADPDLPRGSEAALARALGVSRQTITNIKKGQTWNGGSAE